MTALPPAWPVAALGSLAALTALAGCSLAADLDTLTANNWSDASSVAESPDAPPPVDAPAAPDGPAVQLQDAPRDLDTQPVSADAPRADGGPTEDALPAEDRPGDSALPEVVDPPDSRPEGDSGGSAAPMESGDAATRDAFAGSDAASDALAMCPRSPSQYATLYLMNNTSSTTSCSYVRAGRAGHLAAVDPTVFAGSAACGACVRVETAAAVVVAEVVDQGPRASGDNPTAVAVNRTALSLLAPDWSTFVDQGVAWRFVPCPLPAAAGMTFQFQEGSNANYAALLIENHRFRLASVEYWSNGRYRSLVRASYNYWVAANGMGGGPFTVRVTDVHGHSVEQSGVPLKPAVVFRGQVQFPECSKD